MLNGDNVEQGSNGTASTIVIQRKEVYIQRKDHKAQT